MEFRVSSAALQHKWDFSSRTLDEEREWHIRGKREGLAQRVDTAAQQAKRLA
jgi:hypothetical protein